MATTVKTYIVNGINSSLILGSTGIADYKGCLYYLSGPGGTPNSFSTDPDVGNYLSGGSSGYVMSGYIDFDYPYKVDNIGATAKNEDDNTEISIGFGGGTGIYIDPTNGAYPIKLSGDMGNVFKDVNTSSSVNEAPSEFPIRVGYFNGAIYAPANSYNTYDQRDNLYQDYGTGPTGYASGGNLTSQFGNTISSDLGGGGFYGTNGLTGGYGYSSGLASGSNYGYCIVSLIPRTMVYKSEFCIGLTGSVGITGPSDLILYSLMGGGGGGGNLPAGGGGGGSGDWISGFLNTSNTLNITIGAGGTGAPELTSSAGITGGDGGTTYIQYGSNTINCIGGKGGGAVQIQPPTLSITGGVGGCGVGGAGFFGGGGGSYSDGHVGGSLRGIYSYGGRSYVSSWNNRFKTEDDNRTFTYNGSPGWILDSSTDNYSGNGAGSVNYSFLGSPPPPKFGTSSYDLNGSYTGGGGGGGGFWGGSGATEATDGAGNNPQAQGYGSGGGGAAGGAGKVGGTGTQGFGVINYINTASENIKIFKITSNTYFNPIQLYQYTGFWFFLAGDGDIDNGKSYKNTGHFLVKEDGVQLINFIKINGYFTINVFFRYINQNQQVFTLKSTTQQSYAMIMFYK